MKTVKIGEIEVSKIALGTADFGTARTDEIAFAQMDLFLEMGGNILDTARVYGSWAQGGDGASQKAVGRWMKARNNREKVIICDKGGHPKLSTMDIPRLTPEDLEVDINECLNFLQTDYIDIFFLHRDNEDVPVCVIMDFLHEKVKEGKLRAIGASNWTADRINEANDYAVKNNKTAFVTSQIGWSLAKLNNPGEIGQTISMTDSEYTKYMENQIPVMAYASQGRGFFSRYDTNKDAIPAGINNQYLSDTNIKRYEQLKKLAQEKNVSIAQLTLAALINNPLSVIPITSGENVEQLTESLVAGDIVLSKEELDGLWVE